MADVEVLQHEIDLIEGEMKHCKHPADRKNLEGLRDFIKKKMDKEKTKTDKK